MSRTVISEWFDEKFRLKDLVVTMTDHWIVSVRPEQPTLGALVVSLRRSSDSFGNMTPDECADLSHVFSVVEGMLQATFKPDKINYLALMMVDPQVHFHVIPRYAEQTLFAGITFLDRGWPQLPDLTAHEGGESIELKVRDELVAAFERLPTLTEKGS